MCFDGSEQFYLLSVFDSAQTKSGFVKTLNRKGSAARAPLLAGGFVQVAMIPQRRVSFCSVVEPNACTDGITLSVWAKILKAPSGITLDESIFLVNSGPPKYQGVTIYLSKGTAISANDIEQIKITWMVDVGDAFWKVTAYVNTSLIVDYWHNWALAWNSQQGLVGILDGRILGMPFMDHIRERCNFLRIQILNSSIVRIPFFIYGWIVSDLSIKPPPHPPPLSQISTKSLLYPKNQENFKF